VDVEKANLIGFKDASPLLSFIEIFDLKIRDHLSTPTRSGSQDKVANKSQEFIGAEVYSDPVVVVAEFPVEAGWVFHGIILQVGGNRC